MKIPAIKIILDKKWDKEVFTYFLDDKDDEYDFGYDRIISIHPEVFSARGKSIVEKQAIVEPYVDRYYLNNEEAINEARGKIENIWTPIAVRYFAELEKIFGTLDFYAPNEIKAALSITKVGVIDENNASFQIWYKSSQETTEVCRHFAHEILHFYYYAYLKKNGMSDLAKNWDKAEIFNVVILGLPQFVSLIGKCDRGYQQHEKYFPHYKKLWSESINLDDYLRMTCVVESL